MSFREPDVEVHMTGWPALIFVICIVLICFDVVLRLIVKAMGLL